MKPEEVTVMMALSIANEQAEIRKEVENMIRDVVQAEISRLIMEPDFIQTVGNNAFTSRSYEIEKVALRAIKHHFNNPQTIY